MYLVMYLEPISLTEDPIVGNRGRDYYLTRPVISGHRQSAIHHELQVLTLALAARMELLTAMDKWTIRQVEYGDDICF